jgi:hypothetical protein
MKINMGKADRTIRMILGVIIAAAGIYYQSWWGLVAILPFATSLSGFYPLYKITGSSTCKTKVGAN